MLVIEKIFEHQIISLLITQVKADFFKQCSNAFSIF